MRYWILVIILFCFQLYIVAQPELLTIYDWKEIPALHTVSEDEMKLDGMILKELTVLEYFYDEHDVFSEYKLYHKISLVNSDLAIEMNNKIYLVIENSTEIIVQKARVINRDGSVHILKDEDIIEAVDEENRGRYKYFALEGLQKGCEIEYFYLIKTTPTFSGSTIFFQDEIPRKNVEFKIYSPDNLIFTSKSLNGFPDLKSLDTVNGKNLLAAQIEYIPAKFHEEYALYEPNLMQVIYKIGKDILRGNSDIVSYNNAAQTLFDGIYSNNNKHEKKMIRLFIKRLMLEKTLSRVETIRFIEQQIKTSITVVQDNGYEKLEEIKSILANNVASDYGITKLFALVFQELGISVDLVITCNRNKKRFEKGFEAYHFLEQYLLYFPEIDKYLTPSDPFFRLGFIPSEYTYNYGLFIHKDVTNDISPAGVEVKFINALDYELNGNNLSVNVSFNEDLINPVITFNSSFKGLYAQYFQPYYDFLNFDEKSKMDENIIRNFILDTEIKSLSSENTGSKFFGIKPLVFNVEIIGTQYIEIANNKILFRIGELLGPQSELYHNKIREFDIESDFNREYYREIKFTIPAGYKIKNLNALIINVCVKDEESNSSSMAFTSNYSIADKVITVYISEYYKTISLSRDKYEEFRKVINAAADFNKIALLFEIE